MTDDMVSAGAATPIRIVIADDHPLYRDLLRGLIARTPGFELAGEAATGADAAALVDATSPDVVLMDLRVPGMAAIEATRAIVKRHADTRILILTMTENVDSLFAAMRAGARGYLPKNAEGEELVRAIRVAALGEVIFGPSIAARLQTFFAASRAPAAVPFPELTDREDEFLELIAQGRSNAEIAAQLGTSDKTVRNHVTNVFNKLRVADRSQAFVPPDPKSA